MELPVHKGCICTKVEYLYTEGVTVDKWNTCTVHKERNYTRVEYLYTRGVTAHKGRNYTQVEYLYSRGVPVHNRGTWTQRGICRQGEDMYKRGVTVHKMIFLCTFNRHTDELLWSELPINKWVYWTGLMFWNHPQSFPEIPTLRRQSLYNICERGEGCGSILWNGYDVVERVREGCTLETTVNMPTCSSNICAPSYFNI